MPRPPRGQNPSTGSVTVSATISAINATAGTFQATDRNGLSATFKTNSTTVITLDGRTATLAGLAVGDPVQITYDRTTLVASRVAATSPPPVQIPGAIITALST